jgi:glutaredoxin 3
LIFKHSTLIKAEKALKAFTSRYTELRRPMMTVTIYSTSTCPYCDMAKSFFKENAVEFTEINLTEQPDKIPEMIEKSKQNGVPVIDINGQIVIGFNESKIREFLDLKD